MSDDNGDTVNGTGEATALCAGVAAMMRGANPEATPEEIRQTLEDTAQSRSESDEAQIIDAEAAVNNV